MSASAPPAASTAVFRFSRVASVCLRMSPSPISLPSGPSAAVPARKIRLPWRVAHEYGPIAGANPGGLIICFGMSVSLSRWQDGLHHCQRFGDRRIESIHHVVDLLGGDG